MAIDPSDLDWYEQEDFRGGLWTIGDISLMPANALRQCSDYYPMVQGGLRAVPAPQTASVTGISTESSAARYGIGVWSKAEAFPYFHFQWVPSVPALRLYVSSDIAAGSWTLLHTYTPSSVNRPICFDALRLTTGPAYRYYYELSLTGDTSGIYKTDGTVGNTVLAHAATTPSALTTHQARILYTGGDGSGQLTRINYTDVGSDAAPGATNFILPLGEQPGEIRWMKSLPPSDLAVAKTDMGILSMQGDIVGPPFIRQMTFTASPTYTFPVWVDEGLVYMSDKTYLWTGGEQLEDLSKALFDRPNLVNITAAGVGAEQWGKLGYLKPWLVTANGYIYDFDTKAWHINSGLSGYYDFHRNDFKGFFICCKPGPLTGSGSNIAYIPNGESSWTRATGGTIQSAPQPIGDRVPHVREVQLMVRCFGSTTFVVSIGTGTSTVESRTVTGVASGTQMVRLPFSAGPISASHFDYTITTSATSGSAEAPIIKAVRVGFMKRQRKAPS